MKTWKELTDDELDIFMKETGCRTLEAAYNEYHKKYWQLDEE